MTGPVISISGPPGAGKSTLGRWLTTHLGATRVNYDDYEQMTRRSEAEVGEWLQRGAPIDEIPAPGLAEAVMSARAKGITIYETHLGRAWSPTRDLIDISIWIETPLDLALSRRLQTIANLWEANGATGPHCAQWLKGHLHAYESIVRPSLLVQLDRVRSQADLIVQNDKAFDATRTQVLAGIAQIQNRK